MAELSIVRVGPYHEWKEIIRADPDGQVTQNYAIRYLTFRPS